MNPRNIASVMVIEFVRQLLTELDTSRQITSKELWNLFRMHPVCLAAQPDMVMLILVLFGQMGAVDIGTEDDEIVFYTGSNFDNIMEAYNTQDIRFKDLNLKEGSDQSSNEDENENKGEHSLEDLLGDFGGGEIES